MRRRMRRKRDRGDHLVPLPVRNLDWIRSFPVFAHSIVSGFKIKTLNLPGVGASDDHQSLAVGLNGQSILSSSLRREANRLPPFCEAIFWPKLAEGEVSRQSLNRALSTLRFNYEWKHYVYDWHGVNGPYSDRLMSLRAAYPDVRILPWQICNTLEEVTSLQESIDVRDGIWVRTMDHQYDPRVQTPRRLFWGVIRKIVTHQGYPVNVEMHRKNVTRFYLVTTEGKTILVPVRYDQGRYLGDLFSRYKRKLINLWIKVEFLMLEGEMTNPIVTEIARPSEEDIADTAEQVRQEIEKREFREKVEEIF